MIREWAPRFRLPAATGDPEFYWEDRLREFAASVRRSALLEAATMLRNRAQGEAGYSPTRAETLTVAADAIRALADTPSGALPGKD